MKKFILNETEDGTGHTKRSWCGFGVWRFHVPSKQDESTNHILEMLHQRLSLRTNVFEFNDPNANNNVHVEHVSLHNHMKEGNRIERQLVMNEMVSMATLLPHRVYDTVVNNENNILRENVPGFNNIRSILQGARAFAFVFATDTNLRLLMWCETIFADGTFKSTPVPYT